MEHIYLKTIDPTSQHLLREAQRNGIELVWDRHERQQPQDGFLRLGLNCPYGCLQGPCRIDPFNRGAQRGICGLGRDEMAASMLLRLCLQGTLETRARFENGDGRLPDDGGLAAAAAMLHRPSFSHRQLLRQALRLAESACACLAREETEAAPRELPFRVGFGTLVEQPVRIGISGLVEPGAIEALAAATTADSDAPVALVSLGEWLAAGEGLLPFACTSGEAELALLSGALHLLVAGPGTDAGLKTLCSHLGIPVVEAQEQSDWAEIVRTARRSSTTSVQPARLPENLPVAEGLLHFSARPLLEESDTIGVAGIAIIGGSDAPHTSLGRIPVELATGLGEDGFVVAGWGDAVLWHSKLGHTGSGDGAGVIPLEDIRGPLTVVRELAAAGRLDRLGGICFTAATSCRDLTMALGLALLGCRVAVGTPVPVLGSRAVRDTLREYVADAGGELQLFDQPATSAELRRWFANE